MSEAYEPRLKTRYKNEIKKSLREQFSYTNEMQIPRLDKIVINMGVGEATADSKKLTSAIAALTAIAGAVVAFVLPVRDHAGEVIAALVMPCMASRVAVAERKRLTALVCKAAEELTGLARLGQ